MPALEEMDGYIGLSMLVDRESGRCIATSAWETEEAQRSSMEKGASFENGPRTTEGACVRAT